MLNICYVHELRPLSDGLQQSFAKPALRRGLGRVGRVVLAVVREHRDSQETGLQVTGRDSCSHLKRLASWVF